MDYERSLDPLTSVEHMHVNLSERLVVLPGAVAPKGVHFVSNRHSSMVDSPRSSFQVHRPAQHPQEQAPPCPQKTPLDHHCPACPGSIESQPPSSAPWVNKTQWRRL